MGWALPFLPLAASRSAKSASMPFSSYHCWKSCSFIKAAASSLALKSMLNLWCKWDLDETCVSKCERSENLGPLGQMQHSRGICRVSASLGWSTGVLSAMIWNAGVSCHFIRTCSIEVCRGNQPISLGFRPDRKGAGSVDKESQESRQTGCGGSCLSRDVYRGS